MSDQPGRTGRTEHTARFVLFVASSSPSARRAVQNLRRALHASGIDERAAEVVDVFRHPQRALTQRIFATPALMHATSDTAIYGDLGGRSYPTISAGRNGGPRVSSGMDRPAITATFATRRVGG